jgi:hypothetical protein
MKINDRDYRRLEWDVTDIEVTGVPYDWEWIIKEYPDFIPSENNIDFIKDHFRMLITFKINGEKAFSEMWINKDMITDMAFEFYGFIKHVVSNIAESLLLERYTKGDYNEY